MFTGSAAWVPAAAGSGPVARPRSAQRAEGPPGRRCVRDDATLGFLGRRYRSVSRRRRRFGRRAVGSRMRSACRCGTARPPPTAVDGGTPPPEIRATTPPQSQDAWPGEPNALKAGWSWQPGCPKRTAIETPFRPTQGLTCVWPPRPRRTPLATCRRLTNVASDSRRKGRGQPRLGAGRSQVQILSPRSRTSRESQ
jgi:hypothetical protein